MQEKIILAPGCSGTELLRTLAMHGGKTFNLRIMGTTELALYALMRNGISVEEEIINAKKEITIVEKIIENDPYFSNTTYTDIKEIANVLRRMRKLVVSDEKQGIEDALKIDVFKDKNTALRRLYEKYVSELSRKFQIDSVGLIRRVVENNLKIAAAFETLEEYPLSPLEEKMLETVSDGKFQKHTLLELFKELIPSDCVSPEDSTDTKKELAPKIKISKYWNCYGAPNEVEKILDDIYSGKSLDQCVVAVTDPKIYGQLFFDYALANNLPITFGTGIPITNSNPARLLKLYADWAGNEMFTAGALKAMVDSTAFAKNALTNLFTEEIPRDFWDVLYNLRLTTDQSDNEEKISVFKAAVEKELSLLDEKDKDYDKAANKLKSVPLLTIVGQELALSPAKFIAKYSRIRRTSNEGAEKLVMLLDNVALSTIVKELNLIDFSEKNLISEILGLNILRETRRAGHLHVDSITGALTSLRDNLYVCGLNSDKYPGQPKENYLLLDCDLLNFKSGGESETSAMKIAKKRRSFLALIELAGALGKEVCLSYPGLDVSELKNKNASSLLYEAYSRDIGKDPAKSFDDVIESICYFEPKISTARQVGCEYLKRKNITQEDCDIKESEVKCPLKGKKDDGKEDGSKGYSPSSLETFFGCQRRFMLRYIMGIKEPEEDRPYEILSGARKGDMAHSLMEQIANRTISEDDFKILVDEIFDRFIAQNPPLIPDRIGPEKSKFMDMMLSAFHSDPHREVVLHEEELIGELNDVKLHGFPDRVEKISDDEYIVVDFKTSKEIKHKDEDVDSCLQTLIYAYLLKSQKGINVTRCEYRYLMFDKTICCSYNDDVESKLSAKLQEFKETMAKGDFQVTDDTANCKYCKFATICGKN